MESLYEELFLDSFDAAKVNVLLEKFGVAVVKCYFPEPQADEWRLESLTWLSSINPQLRKKRSWLEYDNIPYGPRKGMMQSLVSHSPVAWKIREAMYPIFKELHGKSELLTSIDGATIHPPSNLTEVIADWPHVDQTVPGFRSIQAQVVLTNASACFRCTPCSNLHLKRVLELCNRDANGGDHSNFLKFNKEEVSKVQALMEEYGLHWQVPIRAPAGSIIFWKSSTIHSAKRHDSGALNEPWRCTYYVCMRPEEDFSESDREALRIAAEQGRTTNHLGTKVFPKRIGRRKNRCAKIENATEEPLSVVPNPQSHSMLIKRLTAREPWP